jgi:hypothetical protein
MAVLYVGTTDGDLKAVEPDPYKCEYGLMDVSSDEAGRDMAAACLMHKERICQKRKLSLAWRNPDAAAVSRILTAVNPEYVRVRYWDAMDGAWETRTFYVGDRSAPLRWFETLDGTRYEELSFDMIEE